LSFEPTDNREEFRKTSRSRGTEGRVITTEKKEEYEQEAKGEAVRLRMLQRRAVDALCGREKNARREERETGEEGIFGTKKGLKRGGAKGQEMSICENESTGEPL